MRYQRGVPLTAEQRGEGGNVAQSGPNAGGYGFNPNQGAAGTQWGSQGQSGDFGQYGNFGQMLQALMQQMQQYQPQDTSEILETKARLRDPVGYYNKMASLPSNAPGSLSAFAPGGAFEGRMAADTMTPAQIMASQGRTAANQWASQMPKGSSTEDGVDTDELRRLNAQQAGRFRTYM